MLGFDALGRLALAQIQPGNVSMPVLPGSFAASGVAQAFSLSEATLSGSFVVTAPSITEKFGLSAGSFTLNGVSARGDVELDAIAGSYAVTGSISNNINGAADAGAFHLTGNPARLERTGFDYEFQQGGIGHLLMEMQRAKQLAAITRTIPPPVDRRTAPTFRPAPRPLAAPIAPAVDVAAIQKQRTETAAAAAKVAKRRREEEAILLLAS